MNVKHIEVGLNSNIGLRRKDNQDSACAGNGVYVVCDGMGGGKGGKQASSDVAERFARLAELPTRDLDAIEETLILAQQEVLRLGEQLGGVAGTTISGVLLPTRVGDDAICSDERCYIVNVGDSRTYHMRADGNGAWLADSLTCITRDHSERQNAIDSGQMLPDEVRRFTPRNIITQCVGAPAGIQPDWYAARADGRFIICSDGLHAQIGREQLAEIAAAYADPQMAADMLVHAALNAGGRDNITVIVVDMRSDMPCDEDWNVSKIGDDEDIDDAAGRGGQIGLEVFYRAEQRVANGVVGRVVQIHGSLDGYAIDGQRSAAGIDGVVLFRFRFAIVHGRRFRSGRFALLGIEHQQRRFL